MGAGNINVSREVEVVRIPSGERITLPSDTPVVVTQSLGGSYTLLVPSQAGLFRLDGKDGDAIGKAKVAQEIPQKSASGSANEEEIWEQLKTCFDPEIPVNIVDLGLIYSLELKPHPAGGSSVEVKMTLTAQGCGMGPTIAADARQKILTVPGVKDANVEVVWDPPWNPSLISDAGKQKLGMA
jgi:probable FeS assembly SUF system protein SufT